MRSATPVAIICEEALRRRFRVYTHRLSSVQFHFHRATDVKTGATLSEGRFVRLMDVEAKTKANQRDEAAKRCAPSNHATVDVIVAAPQNVRSARDITLPEIGEELRANRVYTQIEPRTGRRLGEIARISTRSRVDTTPLQRSQRAEKPKPSVTLSGGSKKTAAFKNKPLPHCVSIGTQRLRARPQAAASPPASRRSGACRRPEKA